MSDFSNFLYLVGCPACNGRVNGSVGNRADLG